MLLLRSCLGLIAAALLCPRIPAEPPVPTVPLIYCTDLFHPHDDPDDHFDLATIYAIPEIRLLGIVLDQGGNQEKRPGKIPVSQLNALTGRNVPTVMGLSQPLQNPLDTGRDQPDIYQAGVRMILESLRTSPEPVFILAVGSVRDIAAAFHREPELFRKKVRRIGVFIGEASDEKFVEYNVGLDPQAYVGLMRSGLPLYWIPCFDGGIWQNQGHASFWQANHADILRQAPSELIQFFVYALERETTDPLAFVRATVDPERQRRLFEQARNLWCTASFAVLLGRDLQCVEGTYQTGPRGASDGEDPTLTNALFAFEPVDITITDAGVVQYGQGPNSHSVWRFKILDKHNYARGMTEATAKLLAAFPILGE
jgi:hypothetical protein